MLGGFLVLISEVYCLNVVTYKPGPMIPPSPPNQSPNFDFTSITFDSRKGVTCYCVPRPSWENLLLILCMEIKSALQLRYSIHQWLVKKFHFFSREANLALESKIDCQLWQVIITINITFTVVLQSKIELENWFSFSSECSLHVHCLWSSVWFIPYMKCRNNFQIQFFSPFIF